jgi:hypothetical protein
VDLSGDGTVRAISDLFSRLGPRRSQDGDVLPTPAAGPGQDPVFPTKAFRKFLKTLATRPSPVLLDLGPVVGSNITFFGEQLGCKILVEDLFSDLNRHAHEGRLDALPAAIRRRMPRDDNSVDGILCWNVLDYLDKLSAQALAAELTRVLRVDGVLLGFFGTVPSQDCRLTKYVVVDEGNLRHRAYEQAASRQQVLLNRDIIRLFDGLRVSDSFLLQTNTREILFRKPGYLSAGTDRQDRPEDRGALGSSM